MDIIDLAIARTDAEALILGNVQRTLRALPASEFAVRTPLEFPIELGSQAFRRILIGQDPNTTTSDGQSVPFYITSINVVDAVLTPRSMAPIGVDDPRTPYDNVETAPGVRIAVLVPPLAGSVVSPSLESLSLTTAQANSVPEAGIALTLSLTVQSQEGWSGRTVTSVTETGTAFVVFDMMRTGPRPGYVLRLVPRIVNLRLSTGDDLLTRIRRSAGQPGLPGLEALALRVLLDTINEQVAAGGSIDLNDLVTDLAGDAIFAPNAALLLTASQLRLRVQFERRSLWFDQPPGGDPRGVTEMRALQRTVVMTEWARFLTAPTSLPMPMGSALAIQVPPLVILERVNGAILKAFDHSDPMGGIPKVIRDLVATLDEEGIPRILVPLSDIRLEHEQGLAGKRGTSRSPCVHRTFYRHARAMVTPVVRRLPPSPARFARVLPLPPPPRRRQREGPSAPVVGSLWPRSAGPRRHAATPPRRHAATPPRRPPRMCPWRERMAPPFDAVAAAEGGGERERSERGREADDARRVQNPKRPACDGIRPVPPFPA